MPVIYCSDVFASTGGDGLCGIDASGDFSVDPLFCNPANGDYTIRSDSPCAPPAVTGCGLVGALPLACWPVSLKADTWARVKGRYR